MSNKIEIAKDGKMDRLKSNWKKLALAVLGVVGVVYYILTGTDMDLSVITSFLK